MQDCECQTHGNKLKNALRDNGESVNVVQALQNRDSGLEINYFCPDQNCGVEIVPVEGHIVRAADYYRRSHFRERPQDCTRYRGKKVSQKEFTLMTIANTLLFSRDFDRVISQLTFVSEIKRGEVWKEHDSFPVSLYARREGGDSLEVILHFVELPLNSANDLYQKLKEIQQEPSQSKKVRFVYSGGRGIELSKQVYQNIIIFNNENAFQHYKGNKVKLTPTEHNFIQRLTQKLIYFDPITQEICVVSISEPQPVENTNEHDESRVFEYDAQNLPYYSLQPEETRPITVKARNFRGRNSINLPNWKLASFVPIKIDGDGNPVSVCRNRQYRILY